MVTHLLSLVNVTGHSTMCSGVFPSCCFAPNCRCGPRVSCEILSSSCNTQYFHFVSSVYVFMSEFCLIVRRDLLYVVYGMFGECVISCYNNICAVSVYLPVFIVAIYLTYCGVM